MSAAPRFVAVGRTDDLAARLPTVVRVEGIEIALFAHDGGIAALENSCPHAGGPLVDGIVENGAVECLWHGWAFDFATGTCRSGPARNARTFVVRDVAGTLEIAVDPA